VCRSLFSNRVGASAAEQETAMPADALVCPVTHNFVDATTVPTLVNQKHQNEYHNKRHNQDKRNASFQALCSG
jgi:hypothetical protein